MKLESLNIENSPKLEAAKIRVKSAKLSSHYHRIADKTQLTGDWESVGNSLAHHTLTRKECQQNRTLEQSLESEEIYPSAHLKNGCTSTLAKINKLRVFTFCGWKQNQLDIKHDRVLQRLLALVAVTRVDFDWWHADNKQRHQTLNTTWKNVDSLPIRRVNENSRSNENCRPDVIK